MLAYVVSFDRECHCITRIPTLSNTGTLRIKIDPVKRKSLNGGMMSSMTPPRPTLQYNSSPRPRPSPQYNNSPRPRPSPQYNNSPRPSPQYNNLPRASPPTPRGFTSSPSRGYNVPPPSRNPPFVGTTTPRGRSPMYVSSRPTCTTPESPGTEFSQVLSGEWIHITESTTCIGQGRR